MKVPSRVAIHLIIYIAGYKTKTTSALHAVSVVSSINNACPYPEPALTHLRCGHIKVTNLFIVSESAVQFSFRVRGKVTNEDVVCCSYTLKVVSVGSKWLWKFCTIYSAFNAVLRLKSKHVHNATALNKLFCEMTTWMNVRPEIIMTDLCENFVIGLSMSEPYTNELNCNFHIISVTRCFLYPWRCNLIQ